MLESSGKLRLALRKAGSRFDVIGDRVLDPRARVLEEIDSRCPNNEIIGRWILSLIKLCVWPSALYSYREVVLIYAELEHIRPTPTVAQLIETHPFSCKLTLERQNVAYVSAGSHVILRKRAAHHFTQLAEVRAGYSRYGEVIRRTESFVSPSADDFKHIHPIVD